MVPETFQKRYFAVVFLVCISMLSAEVTVVRFLSYKFYYHYVFLILSLAQLGIAAGAAWIFASGRDAFDPGFYRRGLLGMAGSLVLFLFTYTWLLPIQGGKINGLAAAPYLMLLSVLLVGFYFSGGSVLSAVFTQYKSRFNQLYAADLIGASLGCVASLGMMAAWGPVRTLMTSALLAIGSCALIAPEGSSRRRRAGDLGAIAFIGGLSLLGWCLGPYFDAKSSSYGHKSGSAARNPDFVWNHLARTDRIGPGNYVIDGDAATIFPAPAANVESDLDYRVAPTHPRVAIIGVGAGPQLGTALRASPRSVFAIDINPGIIAWDMDKDRAHNGDIFHRPEVTVAIDEGRHAIRSQSGPFDVIVMHAIDTYTATSSGAYSLSENHLYTVEAFKDFYAKLSPDGRMSIRRHLFSPPRETLRLFTTIFQALTELGIEHPEDHLVVLAPTLDWNRPELRAWGYLMFSKLPFSGEKLTLIDEYVSSQQWSYMHRPGRRLDTAFSDFVASPDREKFYREYPYFVSPCYDSNPFFFQLVRPFSFFRPLGLPGAGTAPRLAVLYNQSTYTLFYTLIMLVVLTYLMLALPMARQRRSGRLARPPWAVTIYFGCLGLGFMAVEIVSIQAMTLFLGHPVYALGVNLLGLLAFAGIGSALSRRLPSEKAPAICLLIALLAVVAGFGLLSLIHGLISAPFWVRIAVTLSYLGLIGIPMGMPMAQGIRQIGEQERPMVAWAWACNGAAAVVGTNVCMIIMVYYGMTPVFLIGAASYLLAGALRMRQ